MKKLASLVAVATACILPVQAEETFDPGREGRNFAKTHERPVYITASPAFLQRMEQQNAQDAIDLPLLLAKDPERNPSGNLCMQRKNECAGDVRFYDGWDGTFGIRTPVLFTGRSGATISGNVWMTQAGEFPKPGIVITTGSVQAPEVLYWGIAAALAKAGYVVLTYDVQGQGRSDTFGEGADQQEGVPSQAGRPFYDGTVDALDFLLSTSAAPYTPRPSCTSGTSHADKHQRRVAAGLHAPYNPYGTRVDGDRIGIAGHSLGAGAVSFIGQRDERVDAIVAWDNLSTGVSAGTGERGCPAASDDFSRDEKPLTTATADSFKPVLGIANDYGIAQTPFTSLPDPEGRTSAFNAFAEAGVDGMQVVIRGGTHFEYSYIPGLTAPEELGNATLRGMDLATWYTIAWFDKHVKGNDPTADARLLTDRWCADTPSAQVDLDGDGNLYSFYFRSKLKFRLDAGGTARIDNLRQACQEGFGLKADGFPGLFDQLEYASTRDEAAEPASPGNSGGMGQGRGRGN